MNKNLLKVCSVLLASSILFASCGNTSDDTTTTNEPTPTTTTAVLVETTTTTPVETTTAAPETTTEAPVETTTAKPEEPEKRPPFDATLAYAHVGNGVVQFSLNITGKQSVADVKMNIDGFEVNGMLAAYAFPKTGTYNVSYTVTGDLGTVVTKSEEVIITEMPKVEGSAIVSVTAPTGSGNKDANVMIDGTIPSEGSSNAKTQYDTYVKNATPTNAFAGIKFDKKMTLSGVSFTEGMHFKDGGWFKTAPIVEVLIDNKWVEQPATISKAYPETNKMEDHGKSFETYTFDFGGEVKCEGVRVSGTPGGTACFISIAEITPILSSSSAISKTYQNNEIPLIVCSVTAPTGGGNKDITIIADGKVGADKDSSAQYDTYVGKIGKKPFYIGYIYTETKKVTSIEFTEGMHFADGGWFSGAISVEALINGEWTKVDATVTPAYPKNDSVAAISLPWEVYTFTLTEAIDCDGIRLTGTTGGQSGFVSISELTVK